MMGTSTGDNLSARLFLLLSRWSLVTALIVLATLVFYSVLGSAPTDNALGPEYAGLMQAVRSPALYRLATLFDVWHWLMVGGTLIIFARLFGQRAPIRAAFVAVGGIGQLTSALASLLRFGGIGDLAARYATAPAGGQAVVFQSFLDLNRVIQPLNAAGLILQGAGFLVVAWVASNWMGFPRWLAVWLAVPGLLGLAYPILGAVGLQTALGPPIFLLNIVIGLVALHAAMAVIFWRPSSTVVSRLVGRSAVA